MANLSKYDTTQLLRFLDEHDCKVDFGEDGCQCLDVYDELERRKSYEVYGNSSGPMMHDEDYLEEVIDESDAVPVSTGTDSAGVRGRRKNLDR